MSEKSFGDYTGERSEYDPYAILNVPREATSKDIHKEFKRLSKTFHPDRCMGSKEIASRLFNLISNAKDTLLNPISRAAFDEFGQAGVDILKDENEEIQAWQIIPSYRKTEAVIGIIRNYLRKKTEFEYDKLNPSSGDIVIAVDAVGSYKDLLNGDYEQLMLPEVSSYIVNQSFTLSPKKGFFWTIKGQAYNMISPRTSSFQKLDSEFRYHFNDQMTATWGTHVSSNSIGVRCSTQKVVFDKTVNLGLSHEFHRGKFSSMPGLSVSTTAPLWKHMHGKCGVTLGDDSGVSCSIVRQFEEKDKTHWNWDLSIGQAPSTQFKYVREIEDGIRCFITTSLDFTQDVIGLEGGLSQTVDQESESVINCGLKFSYMQGISLTLRFQKGNNRLQFPITLSDTNGPNQVAVALIIPITLYGLYRFYLKPLARRKRALKNESILTKTGKLAKKLRQDAVAQQEMQRPKARQNMLLEIKHNGLIILDAWYGRNVADQLSDEQLALNYLEHTLEDPEFPSRINAKIPLQYKVKDGMLKLNGSKSKLLGLYDVAETKQKHLFVRYTDRGQQVEKIIDDEEPLEIGARREIREVRRGETTVEV